MRLRTTASSRREHFNRLVVGCLAIIAGFGAPLSAQQYRLDAWTADSGLPQNIISAIHQTADGYLWIVTLNGLARFDGVRFTVFDRANSPGILGNRFTSIYEDKQGDLWLGLDTGGLTSYHQGHFTTFTSGHESLSLTDLSGDDTGNLWGLLEGKVMRWSQGRFEAPVENFPEGVSRRAMVLRRDGRGGFWAVNDRKFFRFTNGRLTTWTRQDGLPSLRVSAAAEDEYGTLWLLTTDAGLVRIENGKIVKVYTETDGLPGKTNWFVSSPAMKLHSKDRNGDLWSIDLHTWARRLMAHDPPEGLASSLGQRRYDDREGNLWIGTAGRGLYRARQQAVTAQLQGHNVYPVYVDGTGSVWTGSRGINRIKDGVVTTFPFRMAPGAEVTSISEDRQGRLWIWAAGHLQVFDGTRFRAVKAPFAHAPFTVAVIYHDAKDALWFGTDVGLFRSQHGKLSVFRVAEGLGVTNIKVIFEDRKGALWVGGYGGVSRFQDGKFTNWNESDGVPSNYVRSLYQDREDVLWIGTYDGGLGRLELSSHKKGRPEKGRVTSYTARDGLYNDGAFRILEDKRGYFWISCNRGIYRVRKQDLNQFVPGKGKLLTSIAYGKADGMANAECNGGSWPSGGVTPDGRLWFPTQDGVAVIDPQAVPFNEEPAPVRIETLLSENEPVNLERPVRLMPGQDNFEIQYTALSFLNSEQIKFRYKLEGLDRDWTEAGVRRSAYYSHPPPGRYVFRVTALNSAGNWNSAGTSLGIVVVPPFYRTWWFSGLICLTMVASATLAWQRRERQLKHLNALQLTFSRQLIEAQEIERKRMAGELHDSLGQHLLIIKNRAALGERRVDDRVRAKEQFDEITTAASQAIEEVRQIAYNLRPANLEHLGLTAVIEELIEKVSASSGIQIFADIMPLEGALTPEAAINLYRIIQESINNIVRHSEASKATIEIEPESLGMIQMKISDNGRGFMIETRTRKGLGLSSIFERVRILEGVHTLTSTPEKGTTLTIRIPGETRLQTSTHHA